MLLAVKVVEKLQKSVGYRFSNDLAIQRPEVVTDQRLRGVIDRGRQSGRDNGRFLLLGSAAMDLLRQSGESLAGRVSYQELGPFDALEIAPGDLDTLWVRGGFPRSFLAETDAISLQWRRDFIHTYLERDIPQFGSRVSAETLRRDTCSRRADMSLKDSLP